MNTLGAEETVTYANENNGHQKVTDISILIQFRKCEKLRENSPIAFRIKASLFIYSMNAEQVKYFFTEFFFCLVRLELATLPSFYV